MTIPRVSIIIPIYNTDKHLLSQCINSVLKQTLTDIEIILINDGSTASHIVPLLEKYALSDHRVVFANEKNGGVTVARNKGIKLSKSEYIFFLDSDDYLAEDAIESCYKKMKETNADIVIGDFYEVYPNLIIERKNYFDKNSQKDAYLKALLTNEVKRIICARLFAKKLFENLEVPTDITVNEDDIINIQIAYKATNQVLLDKMIYYYIQNPKSVCNRMPQNALSSLLKVIKWTEQYLYSKPNYNNLKNEIACRNLQAWSWFLSSGGKCLDKEIRSLIYDKYFKNNWAKNKLSANQRTLIRIEQYSLIRILYKFYQQYLKLTLKKIFPENYVQK